jgi:hypothetical protein
MRSRLTARWLLAGVAMVVVATFALAQPTRAATISWKGHTWNVTGGGMAGVCQGNAANVSIDASGYLHMKISNNGGTWTAAEVFSTDKIGFGTYQWQIEGPTDKLDKNVVVGLFPYGPEAGMGQSGNNEIDIEFARWGNSAWPNGNYTIWPPTGSTSASHTFTFSLNGGTSLTPRFTWSSSKIDFATLGGFVAVDATSGLIDAWTFAPADPATRITQAAMPLGMNLWCYENPPSDGQNIEIIVRDFQFVPLGTAVDGGAGGAGGSGGTGGSVATGGASGRDGAAGADGAAGRDGPREGGAAGGALGTGGAAAGGASGTGGATTAAAGGSRDSGLGGLLGTGGLLTGGAAGAGTGGARSGGAVGTTSSGGAPGDLGLGGTVAPSGGSGVAGSGGSNGAGGAVGPAATTSGGCSCAVAGPRSALGGYLLALALLLARGHRRRRA